MTPQWTPGLDQAGAVLTIDRAALRANYRILRQMLGAAACAAVVKADGYGLGATGVAKALAQDGCSAFFVAQVGEGIALRASLGPAQTIFVLNGLSPGSERLAADAGLTAVINSLEQLDAWKRTATGIGRQLPAAVQVDSGMARIGMSPRDFLGFAEQWDSSSELAVVLVMSHLAAADEPQHLANARQLVEFERLRAMLPGCRASLANSSGIFLGSAYHFDLARPGAALYGINPQPGLPNPMQPVVSLSAKVIQTREVSTGAGIGYGHAAFAEHAMALATIALGYADGWPRRAGAAAYFGGVRLPFVGRVSMDSIILDISALPEGRLQAGDLVELIGPNQTVDELAALSGTIGYEILTGLGHRFHRRFTDATMNEPETEPEGFST